jgi:hypothetical protein
MPTGKLGSIIRVFAGGVSSMELKTQVLDRVLEALSPALAAELDRLVQETRDLTRDETQKALEQELQFRLQTAVRETETAMAAAAAAEREIAIAEAREVARKEVSDEFRERFDTATTQLKEASDAVASLQEQLDKWRVFAETQRQLGEASSQPEILSRFLRFAEPFADGLAVYVAKADGLALWKGRGRAFPEIISKETTDPDSFFRAITVRGRTVAAVYAAAPFKEEILDFLSATMERAIEVFGLKLRADSYK